ncbi:putative MFS family arabinose efflux permease [Microbacterium sp. SORGH_AS 888]|nr:putative MFS family arabinose efflux permease [Microbacterium sp. SORGH_AS_0888]
MTGVVPLGISILRDVLHEDRVDAAIALISATLGVGGALGLPISALLTERSDWHMLFWVAAGLGAVVFVLVLTIVPVSVLRTAGRFDYPGAFGLAIGLVGILLAISRGNEWGWTSPPVLIAGLGGIAVLLLWGWYELRIAEPLLDLRVAARRPVLLTNIASIAMGFALFGSNVTYPQLLELPTQVGGFGLPLLTASLVVMPAGLVMMVLSPFSGKLARTVGPKLLLVLGAISLIAAYGFTLLLSAEVWQILVANLLVGAGIGFGYAAMPMLIMRSVPQTETGASNGLNALFRSLGTSSAAAVVGAVLASSTVMDGDTAVPSPNAFQTAFVLGARRRRDRDGGRPVHPAPRRSRGAASLAARVSARVLRAGRTGALRRIRRSRSGRLGSQASGLMRRDGLIRRAVLTSSEILQHDLR